MTITVIEISGNQFYAPPPKSYLEQFCYTDAFLFKINDPLKLLHSQVNFTPIKWDVLI